jgi:NADPH2:quinone reductase
MRAVVVENPGDAAVMKYQDVPRPEATPDRVLIKVKAIGLNRSEIFSRQGHSGDAVQFPCILGVECVGQVVAAPDSDLQQGQRVYVFGGGLGRKIDGTYAEYVLAPRTAIFPYEGEISQEHLAATAIPYLIAKLILTEALEVQAGETLLIRGGSSSMGVMAAKIAREQGLTVISTTRKEAKRQMLLDKGADHVVIDTGEIAPKIRELYPDGVDKVLEIVGVKTLLDSLQTTRRRGTVCNIGMVGDNWIIDRFEPMLAIPSTVKLTIFAAEDIPELVGWDHLGILLEELVAKLADGAYQDMVDRIFSFDEMVEAHQYMEDNRAVGKLVVKVD